MLYFSKIKITFIYLLIVCLSYFSISNFLSSDYRFTDNKINLGLDLQGGSYLLLEVETDVLLKEQNIFPISVAGHSLGEYSALVSSEVIPFDKAIELVILRSSEMEKANNKTSGAMAAVLNSTDEDIQDALNESSGVVVVANYNTDKQIVISGEENEVNNAIDKLKKMSRRTKCIKLNVSGAFHSPLMKFARDTLSNAINLLNFIVLILSNNFFFTKKKINFNFCIF